MARNADEAARLTFQAILYPDGRVLYQYAELSGADQREVIGIENLDGTDGLQIAARAAYAEEGLAVLIAPPTAFVQAVSPMGGTVQPTSAVQVSVSVSVPAAQLAGTYVERVFVRSNDPDERVLSVPVVVQVNPVGAPAVPTPLTPAYAATDVSSPAVFTWSDVGAAAYEVQVATDERFESVVFEAEDVATTTTSAPLERGVYFWRVRAAAGSVVSTWSAPYVFGVATAVANEEAPQDEQAGATRLVGAFPNPFGQSATVRFALWGAERGVARGVRRAGSGGGAPGGGFVWCRRARGGASGGGPGAGGVPGAAGGRGHGRDAADPARPLTAALEPTAPSGPRYLRVARAAVH